MEFTRKNYLELFLDGQPVIAVNRSSNRHINLVEAGEHAEAHAKENGLSGDYEVRIDGGLYYMIRIKELILDASIDPIDPVEEQAVFVLDQSSYSGAENTNIQFFINRSVRTDQQLTVDWAVTNASVIPISGTAIFLVGESQVSIVVAAQEVDTNELGDVTLANPQYVSGPESNPLLGIPFTATFAINDTAREGIIQEALWLDDSFGPHGAFSNGVGIHTFDAADNSFITRNSETNSAWGSTWDMRRIDLFSELGIHGLAHDNALRIRLRYDCPYTDFENAPRNKLFWYPNAFGSRFEYDKKYTFSVTLYFPDDYENDGEFARENLMQLHAGATAPGDLVISVDSGRLRIRERVSDFDTVSSNERIHLQQTISADKGKPTVIVIEFQLNPFTVETTIDSGMGNNAQVGYTYPGNTGRLRIWKDIDPGETCTSLDKGSVTNNTGIRQSFLINDLVNVPVGRVPNWENGVEGNHPLSPEFSIYKPRWFDKEDFANRPAIPHAGSTKEGPIDIYFADMRWGDETATYSDVHPLQLAEPT